MGGLLAGQLLSAQCWSGSENFPPWDHLKADKNDNGRDSKKFYHGNYGDSFPCVDLCTCLCGDESQVHICASWCVGLYHLNGLFEGNTYMGRVLCSSKFSWRVLWFLPVFTTCGPTYCEVKGQNIVLIINSWIWRVFGLSVFSRKHTVPSSFSDS